MAGHLKLSQSLDPELGPAFAAHEEDIEVTNVLGFILLPARRSGRGKRPEQPAADDEDADPDEDREEDSQSRSTIVALAIPPPSHIV
ncbi:MAG: hypothetical protein ACRDH6_03685 [Actinomycetota bacterium]